MVKEDPKTVMVKINAVISDIHRIWSSVPSSYDFPKVFLGMSRAYIRSSPKRSLYYAEKARVLFQKESIVATRYNAFADNIKESGESVRQLNRKYEQALAKGDYKGAEFIVNKMTPMVRNNPTSVPHLIVERLTSNDDCCTVSFKNIGDFLIVINGLTISCNGNISETGLRPPFSIPSHGSRDTEVKGSGAIKVVVQYTECGTVRGMEKEL